MCTCIAKKISKKEGKRFNEIVKLTKRGTFIKFQTKFRYYSRKRTLRLISVENVTVAFL